MRVLIRAWTKDSYHRDVGALSESEVLWLTDLGMNCGLRHSSTPPIGAPRLVIDPKAFPEAVEFEIIVEK